MNRLEDCKVPFSAPLQPLDREDQTYGCRRSDPGDCPHYGEPGICAFVSDYRICSAPSEKWKLQYKKLKESPVIRNEYRIPVSAPLNPQDTAEQTYGCRRRNPEVCPQMGTPGVCAFTREDHICIAPSRQWKGRYREFMEARGQTVEQTWFSLTAPLNPQDTAEQTLGCRKKHPKECAQNGSGEVCAFVREDGLCLAPSRSWKGIYQKLREAENKGKNQH